MARGGHTRSCGPTVVGRVHRDVGRARRRRVADRRNRMGGAWVGRHVVVGNVHRQATGRLVRFCHLEPAAGCTWPRHRRAAIDRTRALRTHEAPG